MEQLRVLQFLLFSARMNTIFQWCLTSHRSWSMFCHQSIPSLPHLLWPGGPNAIPNLLVLMAKVANMAQPVQTLWWISVSLNNFILEENLKKYLLVLYLSTYYYWESTKWQEPRSFNPALFTGYVKSDDLKENNTLILNLYMNKSHLIFQIIKVQWDNIWI